MLPIKVPGVELGFDPDYIEKEIELPIFTRDDVEKAIRSFAYLFETISGKKPIQDPHGLNELFVRLLADTSAALCRNPADVLVHYVHPSATIFTRSCTLLTMSPKQTKANRKAYRNLMKERNLLGSNAMKIRYAAALVAISSFATIGRLPMTEMPDEQSMN